MITLDAATVLLQWAVGGLFFLWVTTRRREVGIGYGWTMRITFGLMAVGAVVVGLVVDPVPVREAFGIGVVAASKGGCCRAAFRGGAPVNTGCGDDRHRP